MKEIRSLKRLMFRAKSYGPLLLPDTMSITPPRPPDRERGLPTLYVPSGPGTGDGKLRRSTLDPGRV